MTRIVYENLIYFAYYVSKMKTEVKLLFQDSFNSSSGVYRLNTRQGKFQFFFKKVGAGDISKWLRALHVLPVNPRTVPRIEF